MTHLPDKLSPSNLICSLSSVSQHAPVWLLQAKNEPAGKKPADKNEAKKSDSDRRRSSDSK